ncbi:hypothetical protein [Saccharothrix obliqua]|uniref:hypothetical protein n=1 Tax=Saccharothrix obliqua TaxID=2861747 RepID=UPI001C5DC95D|nr:hypothetical protein [Saccharothrix obliqua]MBW4719805.1 hypothetical protein [Saccharothrix obliqua]
MPASVLQEPLTVRCEFPDRTTWTARLDGLPNPRLAEDLAHGLAMLVHPHGRVTAKKTVEIYAVTARKMTRVLAEAGFRAGASELTRPLLSRFWLGSSYADERRGRMLLRGYDAATGALTPEIREHLSGRSFHVKARRGTYQPYTESEWNRLTECCKKTVNDSWAAHTAVLGSAAGGTDPRIGGVSQENVAWLLLRNGPMTTEAVRDHIRGHARWGTGKVRPHYLVSSTRDALFPTYDTQIAYRLLFGIYTGIVPDGIDDLGLGDVEWAGDRSVLLDYVKGRTGPEGITLPPRAVRLLVRWLEHSSVLRRFASPEHQENLWIATSLHVAGRAAEVVTVPTTGKAQRTWVSSRELTGDDGAPLLVHRGRIRTTYQQLLARRGWTGRTTIDPNHTAQVEGDHYLTATTPAQRDAVESIIEDGQADILRKALPPVVLPDEQTAQLVNDFPEAVARLRLDDAAVVELVGGERDVFTAACADQLAGEHGPKGTPCPARPWVCLMCPLAVFLPRHAPNLLRLKAFFYRQFRQMTTDQFVRVFGPYADRLNGEILPRLSAAVMDQAAAQVHDDDTEIPLRPEEITR